MKLNALIATALTTLSVACGPSYAGVEVSSKKPTLIIEGVIARGNILPLGEQMIQMADKGEKEVQLIINSPGGQVTTGFMFLSLMEAAKAKGLKVTCFVPTVAASMAFQILLHCDERHSLNNTFLLWHRARVTFGGGMFGASEPMQGPALMQLGRDLLATDKAIFTDLTRVMGDEVNTRTLKYHFEAETLHIGTNLHELAPSFITPHRAITGLFEAILNSKTPRNGNQDSVVFDSNEVIYMTTRFPQ